jgi:hypothetical protein
MPKSDNNSEITKENTPTFIFQTLFDNKIFKLIHKQINRYAQQQILYRRKKTI